MSCDEGDEDSQGSEMEDNRVIYRRAMLRRRACAENRAPQ